MIESEGLDENTNEPEFTMAWRKPPCRRGGGPMSARQNALYRGGLLVSAGAVLGGIGLAALLAFLALYLRKKKKEGW